MCAPRLRACSSSSKIKSPHPSDKTKPSRLLSKGREAFSGSSLRADKTLTTSKAPKVMGVNGASEAPAIIRSASPSAIVSKQKPMESVPAVQPVEIVLHRPFRWYFAESSADGVLNIEASYR